MGKPEEGPKKYDLPADSPAHALSWEEVINRLESDAENGLSKSEAEARKAIYGPNELEGGGGTSPVKILIHQVANALTLVSCCCSIPKPLHIPAKFKINSQ